MEKIYGEYPGSIKDIAGINGMSEIELYMAISSLSHYIFTYKKIQVRNGSRSMDITEDEYALEYLINRTKEFGVEIERDEQGKIIKTGDYASWFEYHSTHFNRTLSKEEFRRFLDLKSRGCNVSRYMPNDSYLDYKKKIAESQKPNEYQMKIPV